MTKRLAMLALPLLALTACSSGSGDATKTVTVSATPSSSGSSDASESVGGSSEAGYPTPPADATPTEPTGLRSDITADQRDKAMSFRNTMNVVVPKSYGLSDTELIGLAAYVCSQRQIGQPESLVMLAIPGVIQRTAPGQPTWDQQDSKQAVYKAEAVYCEDYLAS